MLSLHKLRAAVLSLGLPHQAELASTLMRIARATIPTLTLTIVTERKMMRILDKLLKQQTIKQQI